MARDRTLRGAALAAFFVALFKIEGQWAWGYAISLTLCATVEMWWTGRAKCGRTSRDAVDTPAEVPPAPPRPATCPVCGGIMLVVPEREGKR